MERPLLLVVSTGATLEHFDEPVGQALVLNQPLRNWQQHVGRLAGLDVRLVDGVEGIPPPYFCMHDDVFFTREALQGFVRTALAQHGNLQAAVKSHPLLDAVVATHGAQVLDGGWGYNLRYITQPDQPATPAWMKMPDLEAQHIRVPLAIRDNGVATVYRSAFAIQRVRNAVHVYQANMHANAAATAQRLPRFAFQRRGEAPQPNRIGQRCSIHPTAVVENCALGDDVTVGAYAVCRESVIGHGAHIWDAALVNMSVIGDGAMVGHQYRVMMSVMYPHAFATSGALQFSIMGRRSGVFAAWVTDVRLDGKTVRVPMDGHIVDSGMTYFGLVVGHDAKVSAGVITAPGRVVPAGMVINPPEDAVFRGPR